MQLLCDDLSLRWPLGSEPTIAVVCHGVFLKEFMIHLAEERNVPFPCANREYANVPPNASFTTLTLTFDENKQLMNIACPTMHDKRHMVGLDALSIETSPGVAKEGEKKTTLSVSKKVEPRTPLGSPLPGNRRRLVAVKE